MKEWGYMKRLCLLFMFDKYIECISYVFWGNINNRRKESMTHAHYSAVFICALVLQQQN